MILKLFHDIMNLQEEIYNFFSPCINERKTQNLESMGKNLQGIELGHIAWPSSLHHLLVNHQGSYYSLRSIVIYGNPFYGLKPIYKL